jgi:predicted membrane-bound dolichyl-phosphate-mannose-protein mannosyltransferase
MSNKTWAQSKIFWVFIWVAAILIRFYGLNIKAQIYDMATFEAWSRTFWIQGPVNFFANVWSDYLPLPILTFAPISLLSNLLHVPFEIVFKVLHILAELILIFIISKSLRHKYLLPIALLLLSPALIGDNAFWGQVDTIPSLLSLLSLTSGSALLYGLAVAYKPIMVLIAPLLWWNSFKRGDKWYKFPLVSMGMFFATGIPTGGINFISHLFSRIFDQAGTYPFLTVNAFNLWSLMPNLSWIKDSTSVFSLSGHTFGLVAFFALSLVTILNWKKTSFDQKYIARVAATILILFFTFTTRMHERHLLFGLPFLAIATIYQSWLILPLSILTITFTLNLYGAYYWVMHAQTWPFGLPTISLISWITVITAFLLATIWSWPLFFKKLKNLIIENKILVAILVLATCLRFINLSNPKVYIFDEVYHAFTAREYLNNHIEAWEWWTTPPKDVAYEWTHPPVAKYGMVIGMLLFGENSTAWRLGSAIAGVISIYGIYLLVLTLTKNKNIALFSAFLLSIEGLHIAQSRIAMNDMYMMVFFIFALYSAVKSRWKLAAILYGLALGSKWSALYGVIPLAYLYLHDLRPTTWNLRTIIYHAFFAMRLLLISVFVYVITFTPFILAGHTWAQWWELHRQMWYYHTHLVATHGYQSTPLQWIFDVRPVWYYVKYGTGVVANIYALGNPAILWFGLVAIILQIRKIFMHPYTFFYLLYGIFTIPWIFSPRIMFFYHYLPSATFLTIIIALYLNNLSKKSALFYCVFALLVILLISPMLYGYSVSQSYWDILFKMLPSWK